MAENPAGALQRALVARLRAADALTALVENRIYDEPPGDSDFPYVRIGNLDITPNKMDGHRDWDVGFSIEVHSKPSTSGRVEATGIAAIVAVVLDEREDEMDVEGFSLDWCQILASYTARSSDGKAYLGIVAFEASLAPTA